MSILQCGSYQLDLTVPKVMGIVNVTPDSFSGDGLAGDVDRAILHARAQLEAGADILDIGAESSRPGAIPASEADELARLVPLLKEVTAWGVPVSVDTYKPAVMRSALALGASMINDIAGLSHPGALEAVAGSECAICLMHMQGAPGTMQSAPVYGDVVREVHDFLAQRIKACRAVGIDDRRLVLDPGFGFGKALTHNLQLFRQLTAAVPAGFPVLAGISRKTMLGQITGRPVEGRQVASVAAALLAAQKGAKILRVHDVGATRDALAVWLAIERELDDE